MMNAGQIIGKMLSLYDIEYFFALTGGDQDLWLGLRDAGINYILTHNERCGVAMADAYARVTGKPSFTYGQWGPGAAVCVGGIVDAFWGKSPVICITSSMNSKGRYRYAYQGLDDQQGLFSPITKFSAFAPSLNRLPDILRMSIRKALSDPPGPVHVDIPNELTFFTKEKIEENSLLYAEQDFKQYPSFRRAPSDEKIEEAINLISSSKKPLILAGGGVVISEAWDELTHFAEKANIPVITSAAGKASIPSGHPLAAGVTGNYSRKVTNDLASKCDLMIVIGSNLGDMTTKGWSIPGAGTKIVHIDNDPEVLGANYKEDVSIVGDAKLTLKALTNALGLIKKTPRPWDDWVNVVQAEVIK